jgi:hypothetical protein
MLKAFWGIPGTGFRNPHLQSVRKDEKTPTMGWRMPNILNKA